MGDQKNEEELTLAEFLERRAALKRSVGPLYDEVLRILQSRDVVALAAYADDEYAPETDAIVPRLAHCRSYEDVRQLVVEVFIHFFGDGADCDDPDVVGEALALSRLKRAGDYEAIARDIWNACVSQRRG